MKKVIFILFSILSLPFVSEGQQNDLNSFEELLGSQKIEALNMLEKSFDEFLETNFSEDQTFDGKIRSLLQLLTDTENINQELQFNKSLNKSIVNKFESSGLRKEFWIYGYEEYIPFYYHELLADSIMKEKPDINIKIDTITLQEMYLNDEEIIPILEQSDSVEGMTYKEWLDSSLTFNMAGKFIYAIDRYSINDSTIDGYVDAKMSVWNISPVLIASGLQSNKSDLNEPFVKRIIMIEIYYGMLVWDLKNKETNH